MYTQRKRHEKKHTKVVDEKLREKKKIIILCLEKCEKGEVFNGKLQCISMLNVSEKT